MRPGSVHASPQLSLIVPVHNAASFIQANIATIIARSRAPSARRSRSSSSATVAPTTTPEIVQRIVDPRLRVLKYDDNRGKGYAICYGVVHARGRLSAGSTPT